MKVLLVDDEPFILQGLSVLIDWAAEGCEIVKMASNGKEALLYLEDHEADLVITDIKMPVMSGLELLEQIRGRQISDAFFIILSGYNDFSYAQKAIRYACMDYLVKPVQKEALLELIRKAKSSLAVTEQNAENERRMQEMQLKQYIIALLRGKQNEEELKYVKERLRLGDGGLRYIHISMQNISDIEELSDSELQVIRSQMYDYAMEILEDDGSHLFRELLDYEEDYEIGFVYADYMAAERMMDRDEFLLWFAERMNEHIDFSVILLAGKRVEEPNKLSHSYSAACVLRSSKGFRQEKTVYCYEEEMHTVEKTLHFAESDGLQQPVQSDILMHYSMDQSTYFATLDQYKYNPATIFSAEEGEAVTACAQGKVTSIFENEEIGKAVTLDLGDGYEATYGQLAEIAVQEDSYVNPGETIGKVAAPTKYYSAEGSNVYFALTHNGEPVNGETLFH